MYEIPHFPARPDPRLFSLNPLFSAAAVVCCWLQQFVMVLFLLAALAARLPGQPPGPELLRLDKTAGAMGSTFSVALYGFDRVKMETAADAALGEARRLDEMLSNYRSGSEWSQVNREAAEKPVKVSAELFGLLAAAVEYSRQSQGAFDISVGPLMKVWGFYQGSDPIYRTLPGFGGCIRPPPPAARTVPPTPSPAFRRPRG